MGRKGEGSVGWGRRIGLRVEVMVTWGMGVEGGGHEGMRGE